MSAGQKAKGSGAAATASRAESAVFRKPTTPNYSKPPAADSLFEIVYRDRLWRIALVEFKGEQRLSVWQHYQDRHTGEWKPCGGKCRCGAARESAGFVVPPERYDELTDGLGAIQLQVLPDGLSTAA
jgi:hypothetical protein